MIYSHGIPRNEKINMLRQIWALMHYNTYAAFSIIIYRSNITISHKKAIPRKCISDMDMILIFPYLLFECTRLKEM